MPANRIMQIGDWETAQMFRAACDCTDKDCDLILDIEANKELGDITLWFHQTMTWPYCGCEKWFLKIWCRVKAAAKLLFGGEVRMEHYFIMAGEQQIDDFCNTLQDAKRQIFTTNRED